MTQNQAKVLKFVREFIANNGYSPTFVEIADSLCMHSNPVNNAVKKLVENGYLNKGKGWRNLRLPNEGGNVAHAA